MPAHADTLPACRHLLQITMVFLIVDGAKKLRWKRAEARQEMHLLCSRTIKETLRVMTEGYLCREQPGDLKYMVCFSNPKVRASSLT
jgi:hypothetical protein